MYKDCYTFKTKYKNFLFLFLSSPIHAVKDNSLNFPFGLHDEFYERMTLIFFTNTKIGDLSYLDMIRSTSTIYVIIRSKLFGYRTD